MRLSLVGLLVLCACKGSGPTLRIDLRTDVVPRFEFTAARIELEPPDAAGRSRSRTVSVDPGADLVAGARLAEVRDLSNGDWRLRVTLLDARGNGVLQKLTLTRIDGDTGVTVLMTRDCAGVSCDDFAAEACLGGRCMDARCSPEQPEFCSAECIADLDCTSLDACSEPRCSDGFCFYASFDERCDTGLWCKPGEGCVPRPVETIDAGVDATFDSTLDTAVDTAVDSAADSNVDAATADTLLVDVGGDVFGMTDADVPDGCAAELCNGVDDDCDGVTDEAPAHDDCSFPGTFALCDPGAGACRIVACDPGFESCDGSDANGCEATTDLSELHCGTCGNACDAGEWCDGGTCGPDRPLDLSVGDMFSCVRMLSGDTMCWGSGSNGRFGDGGDVGSNIPRVTGARELSAWRTAYKGTCAYDAAGDTACFGRGLNHQFGGGANVILSVPTLQPHLDRFEVLELGDNHSCGIDGGVAWCWGLGTVGRIGDGSATTEPRTMPVTTGLTGVVDLAVGYEHSCAVTGSGAAYCWGVNGMGELGDGTSMQQNAPVVVAGPMTWTQITTGRSFTCGLRADRRVSCWGDNRSGALGVSGPSLSVPGPAITAFDNASEVQAAPNSSFACAIADPMRQVWCWGPGTVTGPGTAPIAIAGMDQVVVLGVGFLHVCAMRDDGSVWCWGQGGNGELGDGMSANSETPVRVSF